MAKGISHGKIQLIFPLSLGELFLKEVSPY